MKHTFLARALAATIAVAGIGAASFAVYAQPAPASDPYMNPGGVMTELPADEGQWVRLIGAINTAELESSKYAVAHVSDATVKAFAQRMVEDHSSAAVALEAATRGLNLRPAPASRPTNPLGDAVVNRLSSAPNATAQAHTYMRLQIAPHQRTINLLQWEIDNGKTPSLKTFANAQLPMVTQHLQLAQNYLASNNLRPYAPPMVQPVPGHPESSSSVPSRMNGTPNNPAAPNPNGGSTNGQAGGTAGTGNPVASPTTAPLGGNGTPNPGAAPTTPAPQNPLPRST